jgi:hypothetical protein
LKFSLVTVAVATSISSFVSPFRQRGGRPIHAR